MQNSHKKTKMATISKPVGYDCEFVDQVPEEYFCKQCKHVAREPNIASCCTEVVCKSCINLIIQKEEPCPSCGDIQVGSQGLHKKYQHKILALEVHCEKKNRGCQWKGELQHLNAHLNVTNGDCQCVDVDCPKECGQKVEKRNIDAHLAADCPNRDYRCQQCNSHFKDIFCVVSEHFQVCPNYPLAYPNESDVNSEQSYLEDHKKMCCLEEVRRAFTDTYCETKFTHDNEGGHVEHNTQKQLVLMAAATLKSSQDFERALQEQQQDLLHKENQLERKLQEQQEVYEKDKNEQMTKVQDFERKLRKQQEISEKEVQNNDKQIKAMQDLERKVQEQQKQLHYKQEVFEGSLQEQQEVLKKDREEQVMAVQDFERKLQQQQEVLENKLQDKDEQIKAVQDLERKLQEQQTQFQHKQEVFEKKLQDKDEQIKAVQEQLETNKQTLKQQQQDAVSQIHRKVGILPYDFILSNFQKLKASDGNHDSPLMYTHPNGYKFELRIYPNGLSKDRGINVTVCGFSFKSDNDRVLQFPVQLTITLQLLNQYRDQDHHTRDIQCEIKREVVGYWWRDIGVNKTYIPQADLKWNADKETLFLKDDCLRFRIIKMVVQ